MFSFCFFLKEKNNNFLMTIGRNILRFAAYLTFNSNVMAHKTKRNAFTLQKYAPGVFSGERSPTRRWQTAIPLETWKLDGRRRIDKRPNARVDRCVRRDSNYLCWSLSMQMPYLHSITARHAPINCWTRQTRYSVIPRVSVSLPANSNP